MSSHAGRRARVAILGFGHVGSAVAARLCDGRVPGLELIQIFDRRAEEKRRRLQKAPAYTSAEVSADEGGRVLSDPRHGPTWTDDIEAILSGHADLVVEVLGGVDPARDWIRAALARGKAVVTANKQVIARHARELLALASRQGRQLRFEAAVGGAMPIVAAVRDALAGDRICRLDAVLNGTCTFVLSRVEETGCSVAEALREAQARGLAEADPSADVEGGDAAAKLAILCGLAFGAEIGPERIETRTIAAIKPDDFPEVHRRGLTIRQVASAEYDAERRTLVACVGPRELPRSSFLGRTANADNAAVIRCERAGAIGLFGRGAGGDATAVAIVSDLLAIARDPAAIVPPPSWSRPLKVTSCSVREALAEAV